MKRSCAGDNSPIIKKKVREEEKKSATTTTITTTTNNTTIDPSSTAINKKEEKEEHTTTATTTTTKEPPSTPTPSDNMSVLEYIHNLVHNLEQGNIDHCLSSTTSTSSTTVSQQLNQHDADLFTALETNLKKIAQRQLQLETENLRCRIMIQQQHQLLTTSAPTTHHEKQQVTQQPITPTSKESRTTNNGDNTSEDNLTSVQDISLLEKLENSYRQMPNTIPELPQGGYFGNKNETF